MNLRYLWRSLSLVFVLWFALFPTLCFASETVTDITTESAITSDVPMLFSINPSEITSGYLEVQPCITFMNTDGSHNMFDFGGYTTYIPPYSASFESGNLSSYWKSTNDKLRLSMYFRQISGDSLVDNGDVFTLSLSGLDVLYRNNYTWSIVNVGGGSDYLQGRLNYNDLFACHVVLWDSAVPGGNSILVDLSSNIVINGTTFGISSDSIEAPFDVKNIEILFYFNHSCDDLDISQAHNGFKGWGDYGYYTFAFEESTISIDIEDENIGLLQGIIDWLQSIRDGIVNVKNSIIELPSKIWSVMENGIKGLFVPSETDITAMKDKWDTLLSDRFGVVYESGALLVDIANSVSESSTTETITFPSVSYNFSGTDFTFGGYEVDVIPNGFEFLADILKGVIDIVCTLAFINAMRRKYDELMMR